MSIFTHPTASLSRSLEHLSSYGENSRFFVRGTCALAARLVSTTVFPTFLTLELFFKRIPKMMLAIGTEKFSTRASKTYKFLSSIPSSLLLGAFVPQKMPSRFLKQKTERLPIEIIQDIEPPKKITTQCLTASAPQATAEPDPIEIDNPPPHPILEPLVEQLVTPELEALLSTSPSWMEMATATWNTHKIYILAGTALALTGLTAALIRHSLPENPDLLGIRPANFIPPALNIRESLNELPPQRPSISTPPLICANISTPDLNFTIAPVNRNEIETQTFTFPKPSLSNISVSVEPSYNELSINSSNTPILFCESIEQALLSCNQEAVEPVTANDVCISLSKEETAEIQTLLSTNSTSWEGAELFGTDDCHPIGGSSEKTAINLCTVNSRPKPMELVKGLCKDTAHALLDSCSSIISSCFKASGKALSIDPVALTLKSGLMTCAWRLHQDPNLPHHTVPVRRFFLALGTISTIRSGLFAPPTCPSLASVCLKTAAAGLLCMQGL